MIVHCTLHTDVRTHLGLEYNSYAMLLIEDQEAFCRPRHRVIASSHPHYHRLSHHAVRTQMVGICTRENLRFRRGRMIFSFFLFEEEIQSEQRKWMALATATVP